MDVKFINSCVKILKPEEVDEKRVMRTLDYCARICYKSEQADPTYTRVVRNCIKNGHESVIEHEKITFEVRTDRGVSHEIVRHRLASYSQESTRYVNYNKKPCEFIDEFTLQDESYEKEAIRKACEMSYEIYSDILKYMTENQSKERPEIARDVLNNSLATSIIVTMNHRELRNFLKLRCAKPAHPHMKIWTIPFLMFLQEKLPVLYGDITYDTEFYEQYKNYSGWDDTVRFVDFDKKEE